MKDKREILLMQEAERKRIAENLHNTTVQDIVSLSQRLELASLYMDKDPVQSKLELLLAKKQIKTIIEDMRKTIYDLHPITFDDIGYEAAFDRLYHKLKKSGYDIYFEIDNIPLDDGITAVSVYHIVSEACQNIIKHSHATTASVSVKCGSDKIDVSISDNGVGFRGEQSENHFGISFMRERVDLLSGDMKMISNAKGTSIHVTIPISC